MNTESKTSSNPIEYIAKLVANYIPGLSTTVAPQVSHENVVMEPMVINQCDRGNAPRLLKVLEDCGLFHDYKTGSTNHDAIGALLLGKYLNHLQHGDFAHDVSLSEALKEQVIALQVEAKKLMASGQSYEALVDSGALSDLLINYMHFQKAKSVEHLTSLKNGTLQGDEANPAILNTLMLEEQNRIKELDMRIHTYQSGSDYTKALLKQVEPLAKAEGYQPLGKLLELSGFVHANKQFGTGQDRITYTNDLISDALGTNLARRIMGLASLIGSKDYIDSITSDAGNANQHVRLEAVMLSLRQATKSLTSIVGIEHENPELDRIQALEMLVSSVVKKAAGQSRTPEQTAQMLKQMQSVIQEYAQVAVSLAYDHLGNGAAASDSRVQTIRANLKHEAEKHGMTLMGLDGPQGAAAKAAKLAYHSAQDLLVAYSDTASLDKINTLVGMAGAPQQLRLHPQSQLIAKEIASTDMHYLVDGGSHELRAQGSKSQAAQRVLSA